VLREVRRALRQQHGWTRPAVDEPDKHGSIASRCREIGQQPGRRRANDPIEQPRHRVLLRRHGRKTLPDALLPVVSP
jgi:hypothetical protein